MKTKLQLASQSSGSKTACKSIFIIEIMQNLLSCHSYQIMYLHFLAPTCWTSLTKTLLYKLISIPILNQYSHGVQAFHTYPWLGFPPTASRFRSPLLRVQISRFRHFLRVLAVWSLPPRAMLPCYTVSQPPVSSSSSVNLDALSDLSIRFFHLQFLQPWR